jgi:thiamine transport system substrate-binding protein
MFVFPVNPNATLPDVFTQYAQISDQPATLDPALIDANRETWINAWTEIVLE